MSTQNLCCECGDSVYVFSLLCFYFAKLEIAISFFEIEFWQQVTMIFLNIPVIFSSVTGQLSVMFALSSDV